MLICCMLATEIMIELDIKIGKLIDTVIAIYLSLPDVILTDKITILQIHQKFRKVSTRFLLQLFTDFLTSQPLLIVCQQLDNIYIRLRTFEKRLKQPVKFLLQFRITRKE